MTTDEPRGCLFAIFRLLGIGGGSSKEETLPYRLTDAFLSPTELSFFRVLQLAVSNRAVINCKVKLADIFYVINRRENVGHQNRIDRKHVDFLLCDPQTMQPLVGIELDDSSHQKAKRIERDELVDKVFETAGLPLLRVPARSAYSPQQLAAELAPHLTAPPQAAPVAAPIANEPPVCPKCGVPMVRRIAAKGPRTGQAFWGCPHYPNCRTKA
jgi:very-short-patch-repair endonuclease